MASHVENVSFKLYYPLSPTSSICSERSTPSPDSGLECHQSQASDSNFLQLRSEHHEARRKNSTSSDASYVSTNLSHDGGFSDTPDEMTTPSNIDDDILEKFDGLECSSKNANLDNPEITLDIVACQDGLQEANDDDDDDDNNDLQERGPEQKSKYCRRKPYESCEVWLQSMENQASSRELDSSAQQILSDPQLRDKITPCLDQLTHDNRRQRRCENIEWIDTPVRSAHPAPTNHSDERSIALMPSIILHQDCLPNEEQLMFIDLQKFQAAQSDTNNQQSSPAASLDNWSDSSRSSYNVLSSRSHSRASSRAQSPGSSVNIGSPLISIGSPPQHRLTPFRQPRLQSSSSSSSYSFGDTPSPLNYFQSIDQRTEEQLGMHLGNIRTCGNCDSSSTIVNSDNIDDFNCRIQLMNEVIRDNREQDEMQVVPKYQNESITCRLTNKSFEKNTYDFSNQMCPNSDYDLGNTGILIKSAQNNLIYTDYTYTINQSVGSNLQVGESDEQTFATPDPVVNFGAELEDMAVTSYNSQNSGDSLMYLNQSPELNCLSDLEQNYNIQPGDVGHTQQQFADSEQPSTSTFDFPIPKPVSQYKSTNSRRNSFRKTSPWTLLNLPATSSSETLKAQVDPEEVEYAMKYLLKKSPEQLMMPDENGEEDQDTVLMRLVSSPASFELEKGCLAPMVERLGQIPNGLSKFNNRGEDALYIAAINCPQTPHVAGYLAAAMLQKGIDISQRLYQTRGDTLIHALASHGETHKSVLAELLSLKTTQGNSVFDLSKCNYDGRTPLHVAVESHDPTGAQNDSTSIVQLLLENGSDPNVRETKHGNTALHLAVSLSSDPSLIRLLLMGRGCETVNVFNRNRNTSLHMVAAMSDRLSRQVQKDICLALINAGGLTNISNGQGKTPLALVSFERKEFIRNIFQGRELDFL
uniref:NFKBIZ_1 protein n=1 Tax=Fopius arisanus TaxID=64838 RepID=A0A0C9Q4I0_9HYME